ncbi:hypothetical protein [Paracoccus yeei]|uniref:hypothetical protein n=1 Tax=Paracoccus yeei TaxID=147645 RepID=UPI003BF8500D
MDTVDSGSVTEYPRDASGRFLPGEANKGRPRNSRNKFAASTMQQIKDLTPVAMISLAAQVSAGNMEAVKFVLERVVGRQRTIELEDGTPAAVTEALVGGEINTEEAKAIATVVEKLRRIEDMDALAERLHKLEQLLMQGSVQ